jgi:hypothetical protein
MNGNVTTAPLGGGDSSAVLERMQHEHGILLLILGIATCAVPTIFALAGVAYAYGSRWWRRSMSNDGVAGLVDWAKARLGGSLGNDGVDVVLNPIAGGERDRQAFFRLQRPSRAAPGDPTNREVALSGLRVFEPLGSIERHSMDGSPLDRASTAPPVLRGGSDAAQDRGHLALRGRVSPRSVGAEPRASRPLPQVRDINEECERYDKRSSRERSATVPLALLQPAANSRSTSATLYRSASRVQVTNPAHALVAFEREFESLERTSAFASSERARHSRSRFSNSRGSSRSASAEAVVRSTRAREQSADAPTLQCRSDGNSLLTLNL